MKFAKFFTFAIAFFCYLNFAQAITSPVIENSNSIEEINYLNLDFEQAKFDNVSEPKKKRKKR